MEAITDDSYYRQERLEMQALVPPDARRVLEVGCGAGTFGAAIKARQDAEVWGIEPSEAAASRAEAELDRVLCSSIEGALDHLPDGHFDQIVFNDVLEHLVDPESTLRALLPKLAPGGGFIASIPNLRYYKVLRDLLFKGEFEYVDHGVLDRTHLRFFTPKSVARMWDRLGCEVLERRALNTRRRPWLRALALLTLGATDDMRSPQFGWRAKPRS
ncbi:MAG: class I SAM-dependent methyltransferase [Planctomycetes bacterium]|nr:class I SAM-dependent methyltransferase [Planctomycetota bacterium]MCB9905295.1 class I SAM-dependent methyltransferase [Planctomycetota bacterium]